MYRTEAISSFESLGKILGELGVWTAAPDHLDAPDVCGLAKSGYTDTLLGEFNVALSLDSVF